MPALHQIIQTNNESYTHNFRFKFFDKISSGVGVTIRKTYPWIGDLLLNNNVWKIPYYENIGHSLP
jgi:hypothetical protein